MAGRRPSFPKTPPSSAVSSAPAFPACGPKAAPLIPDLELRLHALIQDVKEHLRPNPPVGAIAYLKDTAYTAIREWDRIARRLEEELDPHNR
ncbi:MAG: hypothetical protein ACLQU1_15960 [Bryobacteraceae bacterium]